MLWTCLWHYLYQVNQLFTFGYGSVDPVPLATFGRSDGTFSKQWSHWHIANHVKLFKILKLVLFSLAIITWHKRGGWKEASELKTFWFIQCIIKLQTPNQPNFTWHHEFLILKRWITHMRSRMKLTLGKIVCFVVIAIFF